MTKADVSVNMDQSFNKNTVLKTKLGYGNSFLNTSSLSNAKNRHSFKPTHKNGLQESPKKGETLSSPMKFITQKTGP